MKLSFPPGGPRIEARRTRRWSAWLGGVAWLFSSLIAALAEVPALRDAAVGSEVTLRGWVSFSRDDWPGFFLQIDPGGIYCELARLTRMPAPGDELDVRGFVAEGQRRFVRVTEVESRGTRALPPAAEVDLARLSETGVIGGWWRLSGIIIGESRIPEGVEWLLSTGDRTLGVRIPESAALPARRWSKVQVDGVVSEEAAGGERSPTSLLWVPGASQVRELEPAASVLSGLPVQEPGAWSSSGPGHDGQVVKARGVVTLVLPRMVALGGTGGGIIANLDDSGGASAVELGHRIDVVGWLGRTGAVRELRQAQVVGLVGTGVALPEEPVSALQLRDSRYHARRVQVDGELIHRSATTWGDMLICHADGETFEAALRFPVTPTARNELRTGARLRLTGVSRHLPARLAAGGAPRISVARAADLQVLRRAPWPAQWTARLVAGMALALAAGLVGLTMAYRRLRDTHRRLAGTEGELRRLNGELEGRVEAATVELARSNTLLREENAQRLAALEALGDRERRLVEAQAIARTGSFQWLVKPDRLHWSPELYAICGVAAESFVPTINSWMQCVHPEDRARVEANLRGAVTSGRDFAHEYRLVRGSGEARWVHTRGRVVTHDGGVVEAVEGTCQDITDRKLTELALRSSEALLAESERRFRSLVEGTEVVVWEYDPATLSFTYVSPQAARYGYPLADWLRPRFWEGILHPDDRRAAVEYCEQSTRQGVNHRLQYRLRTASGEAVWVDDAVSVDRRSDGTLLLRGVLVDVTMLKEAETQRLRLEAQLRHAQKMEAVGTLAGGVAHDFNNLLGIVMGTAELARRSPGLPFEWREPMEDILAACRRGRDLVQRMLQFSRRDEVRRRPVALPELVTESLRLLKAGWPPAIALEFRVEGEIPEVPADPTQIQRILMNLATNAAQAIGTGPGRVEVEVDCVNWSAAEARAANGELSGGAFVRLRVRDDGPGMDAATLERVFEPFFTTKGANGTGLGLSVVHGIARAHGGAVVAASEPGKGATFEVYLPLQGADSRTR